MQRSPVTVKLTASTPRLLQGYVACSVAHGEYPLHAIASVLILVTIAQKHYITTQFKYTLSKYLSKDRVEQHFVVALNTLLSPACDESNWLDSATPKTKLDGRSDPLKSPCGAEIPNFRIIRAGRQKQI